MAKVHKGITESNGRKHIQFVVSIIGCMPIFVYGLAMGWLSPYRSLLTGSDSPCAPPLTERDTSWMASIMYFPAVFSVFIYGAAVDRFGRRMTLLGCSFPFIIGWTIKLLWTDATGMIVARAIMGFGSGGAFTVCPLFVKEMSEDSIRGATGTFIALSVTMGNLIMFILGAFLPFYTVLWIMLVIPMVHFGLQLWLPETPCYLLKQGKVKETAKVIGWLRSLPPEDISIQEDVRALIREQGDDSCKLAPRLIFADKLSAKAFWIVLGVNMARECCGNIALLIYSSDIFDAASAVPGSSLNLSSNQRSIMMAGTQVLGSLVSGPIIDRVGRKPLLITGIIFQSSSMCLLGVWFYLSSKLVYLASWLPVFGLCSAIFADSTGMHPMSMILMTEMFSFQLRGTVSTVIMAIAFLVDFCLLKLFGPLISWIGYHGIFFMFSGFSFGYMVYTIFGVPETKIKSLEEIYKSVPLALRVVPHGVTVTVEKFTYHLNVACLLSVLPAMSYVPKIRIFYVEY